MNSDGSMNSGTTISTTSTYTTIISSRLLLWPRTKRRPREDIGLVLGWRTLDNISSSGHDRHQHRHRQRETVICAGVLPLPTTARTTSTSRQAGTKSNPSLLLKTCRECLLQLKKSGCHPSLTKSLEIVAIWTSSSSIRLPKEYVTSGLAIITQQQDKDLPWWNDRTKKKDESLYDIHQHRQVIFYDTMENNTTDIFSHYNSEYGQEGTIETNEWMMTLNRLNHAHELFHAIETGVLPTLSSSSEGYNNTISDTTSETLVEEQKEKPDVPSLSKRIMMRMIKSSVCLLHLQQLYKEHAATTTSRKDDILSWLSVFSLVRCLLFHPHPAAATTTWNDSTSHRRNRSRRSDQDDDKVVSYSTRSSSVKAFTRRWDRYIGTTLDFSLGIGTALLLFTSWRYTSPENSLWSDYANTRRRAMDYLMEYISALEDFPAGFKLNESLTEKMGYGIRNMILIHRRWLESTLWNVRNGHEVIIPILCMGSGLCGFKCFLAIVVDLWRLETLHLWILTRIFRSIYQSELFLLSALFRLFRGKKHNILRQRTDSMQYDAMQLLVGTLGFCICIFLWTTIMVYYAFFVCANWIFNLPVAMVWISYVICKSIPLGSMGWRLLRPRWFTKSVYLEPLSDCDADIRVAALRSIPEPLISLVKDRMLVHITSLFSWLINALIEALLPRKSNPSPCSIPFPQLIQNFR